MMMNFNINLKELTFDNVGKWPQPVKIILIIIFSLLVCTFGYYLIIQGNIEQYDILASKENQLKKEFETLQHQASNLEAYRNQIKTMEERFTHILMQLPTQNEMPSLLEDISKTGVACGLTFELFAPAPEIKHDFYIELPIQIIIKGTYHQLAVFLSHVAQMNRIVTLHDFVIESFNSDKTTNKDVAKSNDQLMMKIMATIYRYRTQ